MVIYNLYNNIYILVTVIFCSISVSSRRIEKGHFDHVVEITLNVENPNLNPANLAQHIFVYQADLVLKDHKVL